jgi:eukaryotic-like serine/threonine-protein kinase
MAALGVAILITLVVITVQLTKKNDGATSANSETSLGEPSSSVSSIAQPAPIAQAPPAPPADALTQLQQLAADDHSYVSSQLADRWIPQLSSKHSTEPWTYDSEDGVTYTNDLTLQEHQRLRQQYGAKLLWSGDWTTYDHQDYWVTVVPTVFPDSSSVMQWCTNNGLDADHCSAQVVSTTLGRNGTHAN